MGIQFTQIPSSIRKPGVYGELNTASARRALPANAQKMLLVGAQRLKTPAAWQASTEYSLGAIVKPVASNGHWYICVAAGSTAASEPTWPLLSAGTATDGTVAWMEYVSSVSLVAQLIPTQVYSADEAAAYFGAGSVAHLMAKAAFAANRYLDLTICAVDDDNSGVKATANIAITGTAGSAGTFTVKIGTEIITIAIASGASAATIRTALNVAVNARKYLLPVVAYPGVSNNVILAARNAGTLGNYIPLEYSTTVTGLTVTLTDFASGATDPALGAVSGVLDTVFGASYTIYASPFSDSTNLASLKTHLDSVSGARERRPAVGVYGYTDEIGLIATVKTLCGTTLNHWRLSGIYLPETKSICYELAAAYGAVIASAEHPAVPLNDLILTGIDAPAPNQVLGNEVFEDLLNNGVTPATVVSGQVAIVRAITTYVTNAQGVADPVLLDITTPRSLDYVRKSCVERTSLKFPRQVITSTFKKALRSEIADVLDELAGMEPPVVDPDELAANESYLTVEDDPQDDTRVNVRVPAPIVRGAHIIAERIDLL